MATTLGVTCGGSANLDGHLSHLQTLIGTLQSLEDKLLACDVSQGGCDAPGRNGRCGHRGKADLAKATQPVGEFQFKCIVLLVAN